MINSFQYVFDEDLFKGYWQLMPLEKGRRVFRLFYPEHCDYYGAFFEVVETGDPYMPFLLKTPKDSGQFNSMILKWFSDYKLLSG
ncbi:MAG TPA: hypothetical protein VII28_15390 [Puia sp.]